MSGILAQALSFIPSSNNLVYLSPSGYYRAIGPEAAGGSLGGLVLQADVTEEEEHRDQLFITEHPVEVGAAISDHAYKRPAEVQMRIAWSNSSHADPNYAQSIYQTLLRLQADRVPFNLYTGKRVYFNMMLAMIFVRTDSTSEFALRVEASMHQVFLVQTKQYSISTNANNLANPQTALPSQNQGSKVVQPPNSLSTGGALFSSSGPLSSLSSSQLSSSVGQIPTVSSSVGTATNNPGNITALTPIQ